MTKLVWDQTANDSRYEAGVDRGVFYPSSGPGEVWNGLTSVQESPSDSEEKTRYIDGVKTRTRRKPGNFEGHIEAFTYPESFYEDVLSRRRPKTFGLSYRVMTGETYKIHLVYNILLGPENHDYQYDDTSPFSWDFTTLPIHIPEMRPTAHLVIDSAIAYPETMAAFEDAIYGSDAAEPRLPSPLEVLQIFEDNSILQIIDHGDGTWTAIGPDSVISMLDPTTFMIDYSTAVYIDADTYTIHSL